MNTLSNKKKNIDKKAASYTAICMIIVALCLFIFGFTSQIPEEEMGMLINFGNSEMGSGHVEPAKQQAPVKQTPPPPPPKPVVTPAPPTPAKSAQEDINTQDFEEAAAIEAAKKKEEKKVAEKLEQQRLEQIEEQRKIVEEQKRQEAVKKQQEVERQQEIERQRLAELKRIEDERKAKEAQAEAIRQQTSNAFGKSQSSNSTGEGVNGGAGNQGNPNGDINSTNRTGSGLGTNGNWSLNGRSLVGSLPKPQYNLQKEGIVVVEISVDKNGRVINATPILRGSTTQDAELWKLAKNAALKAQFNANPAAATKQVGTITYNFVLN